MLIFFPDCFKVTLRLHNDTAANTTVGVFMCRRGGVNLEMGDCGTALVLEGDLAATPPPPLLKSPLKRLFCDCVGSKDIVYIDTLRCTLVNVGNCRACDVIVIGCAQINKAFRRRNMVYVHVYGYTGSFERDKLEGGLETGLSTCSRQGADVSRVVPAFIRAIITKSKLIPT